MNWFLEQFKRMRPRRARLETQTLAVDAGFYEGHAEPLRGEWQREENLRASLEAWRNNPLARRIVELTTQYVVGGGIQFRSPEPALHRFLQAWWQHPLNQGGQRAAEWCDELTRSGELFFLLSTDAAGMTFVRALPALEVEEVETAPNDVQQELAYRVKAPARADGLPGEPRHYPGLAASEAGGPAPQPAVLHAAINRPAGAVRGEGDLVPLLRWLGRYAGWLEDRARLNRYRNSFYYVVHSRFNSEAERAARQAALTSRQPTPGSILVTDESETWEVLSPRLESNEAAADGLALKKMIAAGAGVPLHFLAEPESATRTTAESAGGPAFRRLELRQQFFLSLMRDLARAAARRCAAVNGRACCFDPEAPIDVYGTDLSSRDNQALAQAAALAVNTFSALYDRKLIDAAELLRLAYRFAGEAVDVEALLARAGE